MDRLIPLVDNEVYHVFNRGNNKQRIFREAADYSAFLRKLQQAASKHRVSTVAYTLMPNHYHFLAAQNSGGSLSKMMEALGTSYAKRFNLRYGHVGHVFQGPYKYTHVVTDEALSAVARYIHLNPVRAGLVKAPEDWAWSDFRTMTEGQGVPKNLLPTLPRDYVEFVRQGVENIELVRQYLFGE